VHFGDVARLVPFWKIKSNLARVHNWNQDSFQLAKKTRNKMLQKKDIKMKKRRPYTSKSKQSLKKQRLYSGIGPQ